MLLATATEEAAKNERRVHVNGHDYVLREYVGAMPLNGTYVEGNEKNDNGMPQGFLVHQPPGSVTPAHFHETNQFQVFVDGSGHMGKRAAAPLAVQYANGHTPYGPITAGADGVRYFTLRQAWDPGAKFLPQSRDRLVKGKQRTRLAANVAVYDDDTRAGRRETAVETVIEMEADGLAASFHRLEPSVRRTLSDPSTGGGQYLVVAGGTLDHQGNRLDRWSTVFVSHDEPAYEVSAGAEGLDLLVLQFPRLA
jgi:hypothetical protein